MRADDRRHGTANGYRRGCREDCCRQAKMREQELYRLGRIPGHMPILGAERRFRALMAMGWTSREIGATVGQGPKWASLLLSKNGASMTARTSLMVVRAYDELSTVTPPPNRYRIRNQNDALSKGWVTPDRWYDIDDPNERPDPGYYQRAHNSPSHHHDVDEVVVDRLLSGDMSLARSATKAERIEVVRRWPGSLAELERQTNWKADRYRTESAA